MSLLKFAKKCPEPAALWKAITSAHMPKVPGVAAEVVCFTLFVGFRTASNFMEFKKSVNDFMSNPLENPFQQLYRTVSSVVHGTYTTSLPSHYNLYTINSESIPHVQDLLIPSIMMRDVMREGFSFSFINDVLGENSTITQVIENDLSDKYLTAYKLLTELLPFNLITIDETLPHTTVATKEEMLGSIKDTCLIALEETAAIENVIIAPFKLVTLPVGTNDDAADATSYATATYPTSATTAQSVPTPSDEWIPWLGDECPVPSDTRVDCRFSDGSDCEGDASQFEWGVCELPITAYRILSTLPTTEPALSWDDIRVGTKLRCTKTTTLRHKGKVYPILKIDKGTVYIATNDGESTGSVSYWQKEAFTIEEI